MSDEDIVIGDLAPSDLQVIIERGPGFKPSPRLKRALDDLATALASEEVSKVAGHSFEPVMGVGTIDAGSFDAAIRIGCIHVGCGARDIDGCDTKVIIKCKGTYTTGPIASGAD